MSSCFIIGMLVLASTVLPGAAAAGLSTSERGDLSLNGVPFHGMGVNYYDAFARTLSQAAPTNYDAGFRELAARKIPFARFSAGGFWPQDWGLYQTNRMEYFTRLDGVVKSAERHGIGLIPSLFWNLSAVPDLVGEPCNRWGDRDSRTIAFMRQYTREVVTRYAPSPAIWGWEFGNEYNLPADLPNAAEQRPPVVPSVGTPAQRTVLASSVCPAPPPRDQRRSSPPFSRPLKLIASRFPRCGYLTSPAKPKTGT